MKCLVTGGAGFIGSHLADRLIKDGYKVVVIDNLSTGKLENINLKADFLHQDINDDFDCSEIDYIFHLAALPRVEYSIQNPVETNKVNVNGTLNVLEQAKKGKVKKVIFSSSSAIEGIKGKVQILSPYALQKWIGEQYCKLYSDIYNLDTISLRYFNVFGERQDPSSPYSGVISIWKEQLEKEKPLTITGDGTQTRDFIHISDVVEANIRAMKLKVKGVYNIGSGKNYSLNTIAGWLSGNIQYITPRIEPHDTCADILKTEKELDWKPKLNFKGELLKLCRKL